jgi:oligopeptidase B
MRIPLRPLMAGLLLLAAAPLTAQSLPVSPPIEPPVARVVPETLTAHGHSRIDEYYWLRDRENPEVIRYLEAENAYTRARMAHTEALQDSIYEDILGRIQQTDASVPVRVKGYYYYTRFEEGKDYPIHARRQGSMDAPEQILLDLNELAEGYGYFAVGTRAVSTDGNMLAFAEDTVGRRQYTIRFRDLRTGEFLPQRIEGVTSNLTWANDNRTLFYTRQDPTTLRWHRVYRHTLGTDPAADALVFQEDDETFSTFVYRTKSDRYVLIGSNQTLSSEYRYIDADRPTGDFRVFLPRERTHEYSLDHFGDHFYVRTNDAGARNFKLVRTPVGSTGRASWEEVIAHREDTYLGGVEIFRDHLVVSERRDGLVHLRVRPWSGAGEHYLSFDEPAYLAYIGANPEFDTPVLRFGYTSMTTPTSIYDYDMATRERTLLKRDEVLGGFSPEQYRSERIHATARDGTRVPVSIVYRAGTPLDGTSPLLLYAYGSYGYSTEATFSTPRLALLDRGFIYAIAHIRGGQEMGRDWYEDGKLLRKINTFTDFIDAADHLVASGYTRPDRLFAQGGSAGGLLMGAVVNMRPELFRGVIAAVPFVDVITTMLDSSIPLTTGEYDEWGNPEDPEYYRYMLSYSPYDNVERKAYPNLLVTTGLHDSQVQYWEPAKWVARLRAMRTDSNRLLLQTNMEAGHGGASGRYRRFREIAFEYAFLIDLARETARTAGR